MKNIGNILLLESAVSVPDKLLKRYKKVCLFDGKLTYAESLPCDLLTHVDRLESSYRSGKIIDEVYMKNISDKEATLLNNIMGDDHAFLFIKRSIIIRLEKMICSLLLVDRFIKEYGIQKELISFIPNEFPYSLYCFIKDKKDILPDNVFIPEWYVKKMRFLESKNKFKNLLKIILYPTYLLIKMRRMGCQSSLKKNYEYGIHVWNSWIDSVSEPYRINLVEGQECVNKSNSIYIVDGQITKSNVKKIKSNGFDICIFKEMVRDNCILNYLKNIYSLLNTIAFRMIMSCGSKLCAEPYLRSIQTFAMWKIFNTKYYVKKYLTFQEAESPIRSLCHRMHDSKSIFVIWSSLIDYLYRKDMDSYFHSYYGYLIYDALISNKLTNTWCNKNENAIDRYIDCGIFRSDEIFKVKHNPDLKIKLKKALGIPLKKKVIGFCDTEMGKDAMLNIQEGCKMLDDVYRFLESDEKYHIVYKNRGYKRLLEINDLKERVDRLIAHEDVSYVNKLMPGYFAYDIMGVCDVVIVAFVSSVILECAVGGVPVVCYIPSERYYKEEFVITTFPNFSAQNYDELQKCCKYWLYQSSKNDFLQFQDKYLKKYVDAYCDGKASKRLQLQLQHMLN